jgi:ribonuclease HII
VNNNNKDQWIAGIDEAGRGPLAGPVLAAAVIFHPDKPITGLADSKTLTSKQREALYEKIIKNALAWAVGRAEVEEIDRLNILQASLLAMQRALLALHLKPILVLVDGNILPKLPYQAKAIVRGDADIPVISAASILAKVTRDREMRLLHQHYPCYNFAQNKGYGTPEHLTNLKKHGVCAIHRQSFAPVRELLVYPK